MGCCGSKSLTFEEFPQDGVDLSRSFEERPWKHRYLPTELADIRVLEGSKNIAGDAPLTLAECLATAARKHPNHPALRHEAYFMDKKNLGDDSRDSADRSQWKTWTWSQYFNECKAITKAILNTDGFNEADGIGIWGFNSPYWLMAGTSAMISGGVSMGIYPTDTEDIVSYKIKHCNCNVVFVESVKQQAVVEKLYNNGSLNMGKGAKLKAIVVWNAPGERGSDLAVYGWEDFKATGEGVSDAVLDHAMKQEPGKVINYCYTSGTTGLPKAVMLTNDGLTWNAKATLQSSMKGINFPAEVRSISYLPLSHVAATMLDIIAPIMTTAGFMKDTAHNAPWTLYFARPYDAKIGTLKNRLLAVRPVVFLAVPRVWEKFEIKMKEMAQPGIKGKIIGSLKAKNVRNAKQRQLGGDGSRECCSCLSDAIGKMVKKKIGLDESVFNITGAAPIRADTLEYFASIGLDIYELYGMSEMTATSTTNAPGAQVWGTIGGKMDGIEVAVFQDSKQVSRTFSSGEAIAEDCQGEIRVRGRNIMMGYMGNPALGDDHVAEILKKNRDAIDENGWILSGDKGAQSHGGMFKITGRYKELIITAGGENIAPIPLEDNIKVLCPVVSNIMMFGDKMPYNIALVTIRCEGYTGELLGTNNLEKVVTKLSGDVSTVDELITKGEGHPVIQNIIDAIKKTNANKVCCPSNPCKIQKFTILPEDFSVEKGILTPTLKLKRSIVAKHYADVIKKVYEAPRKALYVQTSHL